MDKKALLIMMLGLLLTNILSSQQPEGDKSPKDTIVKLGGQKLPVKILQVTRTDVTYQEIGGDEYKTMEQKQIQKVVYKSGRIEVFNKPLFEMVDETDWRSVIITDNPDDVVGMSEKGKVESESWTRARNKRSARRSAEIRLQKKAANLGAIIVLIEKREAKGGYGEVPSYKMSGTAYGY